MISIRTVVSKLRISNSSKGKVYRIPTYRLQRLESDEPLYMLLLFCSLYIIIASHESLQHLLESS